MLIPNSLSIIGQLRNKLKKAMPTKKKNKNAFVTLILSEESIDIFFYKEKKNKPLEKL